jgi:hypothetical protein
MPAIRLVMYVSVIRHLSTKPNPIKGKFYPALFRIWRPFNCGLHVSYYAWVIP